MAFMGVFILGILFAIAKLTITLMIVSWILAVALKIVGKRKNKKGFKVAGNIFLILGIVFAVPIVVVVGVVVFSQMYEKVTLPDGSEIRISSGTVKQMEELVRMNQTEELQELLKDEPNLVYYLNVNQEGILEYGLESGNYELVMLAIEYGAEFDNPNRYEHMAYVQNSMQDYLGSVAVRELSDSDIKIIKLMFDRNASTSLEEKDYVYSNMFGKAVWSVLYNDESVSDTELEFIQVFIDNGLSEDENLILYEDKPYNISFSSEYCFDVKKDKNYEALIHMIQ